MDLDHILGNMQELSENCDCEVAHSYADILLCELIDQLSGSYDENTKKLVKDIIDAYDNVDKRYA